MNRIVVVVGASLAVLLPLLAIAKEPTWKSHPSTNDPEKHVMVTFTDSALRPSIARVLEGGTVSWVNHASVSAGVIVFSDEVAASFTCKDLRPNWSKTGTGYQSVPITMGGSTDDLEIPCPLKPGEYEYEVWLYARPMGDGFGIPDNPQSRMQGKIVVE